MKTRLVQDLIRGHVKEVNVNSEQTSHADVALERGSNVTSVPRSYVTLRPSASGQRFCGLFRKPATTLHRSPIDWILLTHHHRLVLVAGRDRTVDRELASSPVRRVPMCGRTRFRASRSSTFSVAFRVYTNGPKKAQNAEANGFN